MFVAGHGVDILVNGEKLREYPPRPDDTFENDATTVHCYVEVEEGQTFIFRAHLGETSNWSSNAKQSRVSINGKIVVNQINISSARSRYQPNSVDITGSRSTDNGKQVERAFEFQKLRTTDSSSTVQSITELAKSIGIIEIRISDYSQTSWEPRTHTLGRHDPNWQDPGAVPEKATKGRPIDVTAGLSQERRPVDYHRVIGTSGSVLATFIFHPMTRRALQVLDIIPTTPEPVTLEERDLDDLSAQELRQLVSRLREQRSTTPIVKREIKLESNHPVNSNDTSRKRWRPIDSDDDDVVEVSPPRKSRKALKTEHRKPTNNAKINVLEIDDLD